MMGGNSTTTFGEVLKRFRLSARLSQDALAERAHLTAQAISALERGLRNSPRRDTILALAQALGLSRAEQVTLAAAAKRRRGVPRAASGTDQAFDPGGSAHGAHLPTPLTTFVGRTEEVASVIALLQRPAVRLLTLTGPAGVGKTRLALQVASSQRAAFADGVWLITLAAVTDTTRMLSAVAQALGVREMAGQALIETLKRQIGTSRLLLLLDNFEHLLGAAPDLTELLAGCPWLTFLVTSRARLQVQGEHVFVVTPLPLPGAPETGDPLAQESEAQNPAVTLFLQRAQALKPDLTLNATNTDAIAAICRQLDGLPLAIELAAGRAKLLAPRALLARLDSRLRVLTGGAHDLPERHQTLRAAIDWSYELLSAGEQVVFRLLCVFAGGCSLEAALAVCSTDGDPAGVVLDWIAALVDKSLLRQETQTDSTPRLYLLETIREFGLERLKLHGEYLDARRRHTLFYLSYAEQAAIELTGPGQASWLVRLRTEQENLRLVLYWAREQGELELGLRCVVALQRFWLARGQIREGRGWLEAFLWLEGSGSAETSVPLLRARALYAASNFASEAGDVAQALAWADQSLALSRDLNDRQGTAMALNTLASVARYQGDIARAEALYGEALSLFQELADRRRAAVALNNLGLIARDQGDHARAAALLEHSLLAKRELGDERGIGLSLINLGDVTRALGEPERAATCYREGLALFRELEDRSGIALVLNNLGDLARDQGEHEQAMTLYTESLAFYGALGDTRGNATVRTSMAYLACDGGHYEHARDLYREGLRLYLAMDAKPGVIDCLEGLAIVNAHSGRPQHAARLFGAAEALRAAFGTALQPSYQAAYRDAVTVVRAVLAERDYTQACQAGGQMTLEEAVRSALDQR